MQNNDTPRDEIVKLQKTATGPRNANARKVISITLKDHILYAVREYAQENSCSEANAIKDLLEFRLFQLGKLPSWWYERGSILRGTQR